jgi:hypothetical protein
MRRILFCAVIGFFIGKNAYNHNPIKIRKAFDETPYDLMEHNENMTNLTYVKLIQVKNIQKTCDELKGSPYPYTVLACAHFRKFLILGICSVYTDQTPSYWTLGHEMRHCFQGHFHD